LIQPDQPTPTKVRQSRRVINNTLPVIIIPPYKMLVERTRASDNIQRKQVNTNGRSHYF
jgi:hypothetical protein